MTKTLQKQAAVIALIMKLLSVVCTGWLFFMLAGNEWIGGLTAAGGVVIQWLAFLMTPLGVIWLIRKQWGRGIVALLYGAITFGVSTLAGVAFLEQGEQSYRKDSDRYALTTSVMELRTEAARVDIEKGFRERGLETLNKVEEQELERASLGSDSPLSKLAELYGVHSESARRVVFLLFILLLDGGAVLACCLLALEREQEREPEEEGDITQADIDEAARLFLYPETSEKQEQEHSETGTEEQETAKSDSKLDDAVSLIKEQIQGSSVSLRFVKDSLRVGYPKAKTIMKQLEAMGLIEASGKSYQVIECNEAGQS